jgi:acyl-CoA thioesterase-1
MRPSRTIRKLQSGMPVVFAAIGDSLTYGWMAEKGYLDFLQEMLEAAFPKARIRILNRGVPGDTAEGGLYRLSTDVIPNRPDCVLIQFALNDAFSGYQPTEFEENIERMVDGILQAGDSEIILVTSVWFEPAGEFRRAEEFYDRLRAVAERKKLSIAKVHEFWKNKIDLGIDFRKMVQSDGIHPTSEGYRLMAEAVAEVFIN